jgi:hypothetical protein
MSKLYTTEVLVSYANYHAVRLIDFEGQEYKGWLVPEVPSGDLLLLPLNDIWHIYKFKRSHIKEIYHLTNGVLIPKEVEKDFNIQ